MFKAACRNRTLNLPLSQTHFFALTGAGASVSPKGREKGEATQARPAHFMCLHARIG